MSIDYKSLILTNLSIQNLLLQVSNGINTTSLFLEFIKSNYEAIKEDIDSLKSSESWKLIYTLQAYVDLLCKVNGIFCAALDPEDIKRLMNCNETVFDSGQIRVPHSSEYDTVDNPKHQIFKLKANKTNPNCSNAYCDHVLIEKNHFYEENLKMKFCMCKFKQPFKKCMDVKDKSQINREKSDFDTESGVININLEKKVKKDQFSVGTTSNHKICGNECLTEENSFLKSTEGIHVVIKHVQSPSEFYVLFQDDKCNFYEELEKKLKTISINQKSIAVKKTCSYKHSMSHKMNDNVLYYSICDETWFRAKILDWCLQFDDDLVTVFMTDTGETKCVSICYLQSMPEFIRNYPIALKRCHLTGICPKGKKNQDDISKFDWMKIVTEQVKMWIETSEKALIKIDSLSNQNPSSLPVTLWLTEKDKSVNELLINSDLADRIAVPNISSETMIPEENLSFIMGNSNLENWNPMKEDYEAYNNVPELNPMNPATAIYGYIGKDNLRICHHFGTKGKCFKHKACKKEHKFLNPLGFTVDQEKVFVNTINSHRNLLVNEILRIQITQIFDVNNFCCQLKNSGSVERGETLCDLQTFLNKPQNIQCMKKLAIPPSPGQIVICKCPHDGSWNRAQVLDSEPESDKYSVLFVDYGNTETVPLSKIRAIEPEYLHLPFQCVSCVIHGIQRDPKKVDSSPEEGIRNLTKVIKNRNLFIKVASALPGNMVSLSVHLYDDEGNDIAQELIDNDYVVRKEELFLSHDSQILPG